MADQIAENQLLRQQGSPWARYAALMRAGGLVGLIIVLLAILLGLGITMALPSTYASYGVAQLSPGLPVLSPSDALAANTLSKERVKAHVELARGVAVAEEVKRDLGLPDKASELMSTVSAEQVTDTALLKVTVRSDSADKANRVAKAWMTALKRQVAKVEIDPSGRAALTLQEVETPVVNNEPVAPSRRTNVVVAAALGAVLATGYAIWRLDRPAGAMGLRLKGRGGTAGDERSSASRPAASHATAD